MNAVTTTIGALAWIIFLCVAFYIFFIPARIARRRNVIHYKWIVLANVVAGATGAGWVLVLIWALYDDSIDGGPSIPPPITAIYPPDWKPRSSSRKIRNEP